MLVQVTKEDKYENYTVTDAGEKLIGLLSPGVVYLECGRYLEPGEKLFFKIEYLCKED